MNDTFSRIAIITGATSGIGEATARTFLEEGYGVVANGRNQEKLDALGNEYGAAVCGVTSDASDEAVIDRLFSSAEEHFGRQADIVVANAGRGLGGTVKDADFEAFKQIQDINVTGTLYLLQQASRKMVERQKDRYPDSAADIVVIGSTVGRNISPFSSVYGATKSAVHSMTEALRREIGPEGVRVTLVEPGIVISKFQERAGYSDNLVENFHEKFGPLLQTDDVAHSIQYVVSRPPHVHICDFVMRSTRQDYP